MQMGWGTSFLYTELFRRRIPSCIFPIQLTKFSSNVTLNYREVVKHYCHMKERGKLKIAIMVISQIVIFRPSPIEPMKCGAG